MTEDIAIPPHSHDARRFAPLWRQRTGFFSRARLLRWVPISVAALLVLTALLYL